MNTYKRAYMQPSTTCINMCKYERCVEAGVELVIPKMLLPQRHFAWSHTPKCAYLCVNMHSFSSWDCTFVGVLALFTGTEVCFVWLSAFFFFWFWLFGVVFTFSPPLLTLHVLYFQDILPFVLLIISVKRFDFSYNIIGNMKKRARNIGRRSIGGQFAVAGKTNAARTAWNWPCHNDAPRRSWGY